MIMPDRIYTFQQSMIIMRIEELDHLMTYQRVSNKKQIFKLYKSIVRRTNNEIGLPERLKYKNYFDPSKRKNWKRRNMDDKISDWLVELHRFYDESASRTAPR